MNLDDRITQCKADIQKLEEELTRLNKEKTVFVPKSGDAVKWTNSCESLTYYLYPTTTGDWWVVWLGSCGSLRREVYDKERMNDLIRDGIVAKV